MIPKECKRLAEVDFPIAVVSAHAAREKSIRHGHPSTLHLWWARRPLASCRAMLMSLLLPDPADEHCPREFREQAARLLGSWTNRLKGVNPQELPPKKEKVAQKRKSSSVILREELLSFIGRFADWDNAANPIYLDLARGLVRAAHPEETPLVVDPFAGGGSIPLEALRLGCDAFASDLNPVACLISKVLLEDIPRHGPELAEELRKVGAEVKVAAEKELTEFYPPDPDGARPIAYLWARTVRCETPNCGAEIPLVRSFWLSKKATRKWAMRSKVVRPTRGTPYVELEIFEPLTAKDIRTGTVSRAKATCLCCNTVLGPDRVRAQLAGQRGGADVIFDGKQSRTGGARLLAVVTLKDGRQGRNYRLPTDVDYKAVWKAQQQLKKLAAVKRTDGLSVIPDESTPAGGGSGAGRAFSVQKYGMMQWGDLFTARQKTGLLTLQHFQNKSAAAQEVSVPLALAISRCCDQISSLVRWRITVEAVAGTFGRNALPIVWDFVEIVPAGDDGSNFIAAVEWVAEAIEKEGACVRTVGQIAQADATKSLLEPEGVSIWFTDPPYYDAIPYSDLSDYFLVWLKRMLPGHSLLRDPFDATNALSPKLQEAVQDETSAASAFDFGVERP
jgi:putative DNA methylase